ARSFSLVRHSSRVVDWAKKVRIGALALMTWPDSGMSAKSGILSTDFWPTHDVQGPFLANSKGRFAKRIALPTKRAGPSEPGALATGRGSGMSASKANR